MDQLDRLESILKKGYFILYQMSAAEYESQTMPNSNTSLYLDQWISQLNALEGLDLVDIQIPSELLTFLDDGENPAVFYQKQLEKVMLMNQKTYGKIVALKKLQNAIKDSI